MPKYRLFHLNMRTGQRTKQLTRLEKDVWEAIIMSADDFGVCPHSAPRLQADDPWLTTEKRRHIELAIEIVVKVGLFRTFVDGKDTYLYQPDWQDFQKIEHAMKSTMPCIPVADLEQFCTTPTVMLVLEHHDKRRQIFENFSETFRRQFPETFANYPPKVRDKFATVWGKFREPVAIHARAADATANANASAVLGRGAGETQLPVRPLATRAHLVEAPSKWSHAYHEGGFCDWMCFPADLFDQFTKRIERSHGLDHQAARKFVAEWADGVRASGINPTGKMYDFWNGQWESAHGSSKPVTDGAAGRHERTKQRLDRFVENG